MRKNWKEHMTLVGQIAKCLFVTVILAIIIAAGSATLVTKFLGWQGAERERTRPRTTTESLRERVYEAVGYIAVIETVNFYKKHKNNNGYNQEPEHLLNVWNLCEAYAETITDTRWVDALNRTDTEKEKIKEKINSLNIPLFMYCVAACETAYDPNAVATNRNKTQDFGITQINENCHAEIEPWMPADLRERPWTDTEKNIAGRYVWIMNRIRAGQAWDLMTQARGWKLYRRIEKATAGARETARARNY